MKPPSTVEARVAEELRNWLSSELEQLDAPNTNQFAHHVVTILLHEDLDIEDEPLTTGDDFLRDIYSIRRGKTRDKQKKAAVQFLRSAVCCNDPVEAEIQGVVDELMVKIEETKIKMNSKCSPKRISVNSFSQSRGKSDSNDKERLYNEAFPSLHSNNSNCSSSVCHPLGPTGIENYRDIARSRQQEELAHHVLTFDSQEEAHACNTARQVFVSALSEAVFPSFEATEILSFGQIGHSVLGSFSEAYTCWSVQSAFQACTLLRKFAPTICPLKPLNQSDVRSRSLREFNPTVIPVINQSDLQTVHLDPSYEKTLTEHPQLFRPIKERINCHTRPQSEADIEVDSIFNNKHKDKHMKTVVDQHEGTWTQGTTFDGGGGGSTEFYTISVGISCFREDTPENNETSHPVLSLFQVKDDLDNVECRVRNGSPDNVEDRVRNESSDSVDGRVRNESSGSVDCRVRNESSDDIVETVSDDSLDKIDIFRDESLDKIVDTFRDENIDKIVDTFRNESLDKIDTFRDESLDKLDTFRNESLDKIDTFRDESLDKLDTFRNESLDKIDTFKDESLDKIVNTFINESIDEIVDTFRDESLDNINIFRNESLDKIVDTDEDASLYQRFTVAEQNDTVRAHIPTSSREVKYIPHQLWNISDENCATWTSEIDEVCSFPQHHGGFWKLLTDTGSMTLYPDLSNQVIFEHEDRLQTCQSTLVISPYTEYHTVPTSSTRQATGCRNTDDSAGYTSEDSSASSCFYQSLPDVSCGQVVLEKACVQVQYYYAIRQIARVQQDHNCRLQQASLQNPFVPSLLSSCLSHEDSQFLQRAFVNSYFSNLFGEPIKTIQNKVPGITCSDLERCWLSTEMLQVGGLGQAHIDVVPGCTCSSWLENNCHLGDSCPFSHPSI